MTDPIYISASPSLQEWIDALKSLNDSVVHVWKYTTIFDINVNGVTYTNDPSKVTWTGYVTCPIGMTALKDVCGKYLIYYRLLIGIEWTIRAN